MWFPSDELTLELVEIESDVFLGDKPVAQLEDVQEPETRLAALAVQFERAAVDHMADPNGLVDDKILSIRDASRAQRALP